MIISPRGTKRAYSSPPASVNASNVTMRRYPQSKRQRLDDKANEKRRNKKSASNFSTPGTKINGETVSFEEGFDYDKCRESITNMPVNDILKYIDSAYRRLRQKRAEGVPYQRAFELDEIASNMFILDINTYDIEDQEVLSKKIILAFQKIFGDKCVSELQPGCMTELPDILPDTKLPDTATPATPGDSDEEEKGDEEESKSDSNGAKRKKGTKFKSQFFDEDESIEWIFKDSYLTKQPPHDPQFTYLHKTVAGFFSRMTSSKFGINISCSSLMLITVISAALICKVRKSHGYSVFTNLFTVIAGPPGSGKSPAANWLSSYIRSGVTWTQYHLGKLRPDISPDAFDFSKQACGSFAKIAINSEETSGHNFFIFDEAATYTKTFNVNKEGNGTEETAALTTIYDAGPLNREFVDDVYSVHIPRCIWSMFVLGQLKVLKSIFENHTSSGFTNRNVFAYCGRGSEENIHLVRSVYSTSDWRPFTDLVTHYLLRNIMTGAFVDTIRTKNTKTDHHLVFQATAPAEMYLFIYDLIIILWCHYLDEHGNDGKEGMITMLKKSTVQIDKICAIMTAITYYATKQTNLYTQTEEWIRRKVGRSRKRDHVVYIDNKNDILASVEILIQSFSTWQHNILGNNSKLEIPRQICDEDFIVRILERIPKNQISEMRLNMRENKELPSRAASVVSMASSAPMKHGDEEDDDDDDDDDDDEEASLEVKNDDASLAEVISIPGAVLLFPGSYYPASTLSTIQFRFACVQKIFGINYNTDRFSCLHDETASFIDRFFIEYPPKSKKKKSKNDGFKIVYFYVLHSLEQHGFLQSYQSPEQGFKSTVFKYPIQELSQWLHYKKNCDMMNGDGDDDVTVNENPAEEASVNEQPDNYNRGNDDDSEASVNQMPDYPETITDETKQFIKFLVTNGMCVSTYIDIYLKEKTGEFYTVVKEAKVKTTRADFTIAKTKANKILETKILPNAPTNNIKPTNDTTSSNKFPCLSFFDKFVDYKDLFDYEDRMWKMEKYKKKNGGASPYFQSSKSQISGIYNQEISSSLNNENIEESSASSIDLKRLPRIIENIVQCEKVQRLIARFQKIDMELKSNRNEINSNMHANMEAYNMSSHQINSKGNIEQRQPTLNKNQWVTVHDKDIKKAAADAKKNKKQKK